MALRLLKVSLSTLVCYTAAKAAKGKSKKDDGWTEKINDEGKKVQELKIEAPSMTEEDQFGYVMPAQYKCDSCRAVVFHLDAALKKVHPKSRRMKQWEYTDAFDDACKNSFEGYGIKLLNGKNTLSGPGLTHEEGLQPGMGAIQMGGETWTKRLSEACRAIIYERVGEDELYDKYREDGGLTENICYQDLRDCHHGPSEPPKPKENSAEASKAKPKKEKKEKKKETKASSSAKADSKTAASSSTGAIDSQTFLRNIAVKHGLTSDEYLTARTEKEWEKLVVAMAGRIFNNNAKSEL